MVLFVLVAPVPVGSPLCIRGAVPVYVGSMLLGPILMPIPLFICVPVVIVSVLLVVVTAVFVVSIMIIPILFGGGGCDWH
jgi:hypothetical protein